MIVMQATLCMQRCAAGVGSESVTIAKYKLYVTTAKSKLYVTTAKSNFYIGKTGKTISEPGFDPGT